MGAVVDDEEYSSSLGAFIHAVYVGEHKAQKRGDTEAVAKYQGYKTRLHNALSERIPAEGGFLVPEVLRSEILMVALGEGDCPSPGLGHPDGQPAGSAAVNRRHDAQRQRLRWRGRVLDRRVAQPSRQVARRRSPGSSSKPEEAHCVHDNSERAFAG